MSDKVIKKLINDILEILSVFVYSIIITVILFTFVFRMVSVVGESMVPTLHNEDRLVINNFFYTPKYGDIVVITKKTKAEGPIIKRVIATGGQEIDIDFENAVVTVDGRVLDEPYIKDYFDEEKRKPLMKKDIDFPQTVPEGCVFVMGDNRNASHDSRTVDVGMVREEYILGEAVFRVFPFGQMGFFEKIEKENP